MSQKLSESKIMQALDWAYDKAVNGVPGLNSASELAETYMKKSGSRLGQANAFIRWQKVKAGTSGFLMGFGGLLTMPVTVPSNISSVMYIQIRMIAAIAHMGGYDLRDDRVKSLVYVCLTGNAAKDILKDIGVVVGTKLTASMVSSISSKTLTVINQKVGFRLLTKFGEEGAIHLAKIIPLVGGLIGATSDSLATNTIGKIATGVFITEKSSAREECA
ncbi:MAG: EcsC family protein [SAR324 cluster bacterium]|uniref:EcsC family protein n=1 Tax=SAR324 cluster bacterium TaxID=2024889 RepID=A0A2A4SL27_9DELT|nr:MAG: EcsC family protein [SAR324 cluster bacterium]